ncbi:hypothetical protein FPZ24_10670 [Sphingomonas panacisoli]|uniref:Uncharacterized protein n=1 Tax=Sphingomonas panacisoli TaxID=1813879 RepID=A0A5B8LII5_9SPHN|nr:hypothetical protein [Sphingomonas panacisoli]QDZ07891.1 hypothetical protein FPZ24_10670 [Sphingomonas panacisoli]
MKRLAVALTALPLLASFSTGGRAEQSATVYANVAPMNDTVEGRIMPQTNALLDRLLRERRAMTLGGVKVFESGDKFLPGKIAAMMAYRLLDTKRDDPMLAQRLTEFADIADLTVDDPNESWGIYYYASALNKLREAGLFDRAVRPATLAKLRISLDWRRFVRADLTLIDLPNNYYGVAFSIARLRYLLGWEDATSSDALLARMIDHYRRYSGQYGFADETEGKGRFDRYSVLLIGEIAQRLIETDMKPTPDVLRWLRRSVDVMLPRFNETGEGFEYGRSIGPYGETCFLEVLTAAARFKVLTPTEQDMAYAFSSRIAARYADFWTDPATGSVDMWDDGRRTDTYRGKHRIFGENLSLARQYLYTNAIWNGLGYRDRPPVTAADYRRWLDALPRSTTTWFARGTYDRALVTVRDRGTVIGLPTIDGAEGQHMHNPYFPIPFSPGLLQGAADTSFPQLVPRITLTDGTVLMPLAWFKDIRVSRTGATTTITWRQDALDRMGGNDAVDDRRVSIVTRYVLSPGRIARSDTISVASGTAIDHIDLEFATFSTAPRAVSAGAVTFGEGRVTGFAANGLGSCNAGEAGPTYRAPNAAFRTAVKCRRDGLAAGRSLRMGWTIDYRATP